MPPAAKKARTDTVTPRRTPARGAKKGAKTPEAKNNKGGAAAAAADKDPTTTEEVIVDDGPPALPPVDESAFKSDDADGEEGTTENNEGNDDSLDDPLTSSGKDFRGGQENWNAMLYQLILFKTKNGDLNITPDEPGNRALFNWIQTQRRHYELYMDNKTSSTFLNADRIAVLDAIDFQWNIRGDSFWQKHFDALVAYKREYGDVRVPRHYSKNSKLGEWVTDQRRQYKAKSEGKPTMLTDERKAQLDELGFVWKVRDRADWNDRYEQLLEFKKENGHCIVPQHYVRNRALGKWVAKQREQYRFFREGRHSFLTEERIDLLKSINFTWQIKGRNKQRDLNNTMPTIDSSTVPPVIAKPSVKTDDAILKDAAENTPTKTGASSTTDATPTGKVESKAPSSSSNNSVAGAAGTIQQHPVVPPLPPIQSQMSAAGMAAAAAAGMTAADAAMNPVNALQQQLLLQQHRNMSMAAGMVPGAAAANFNLAMAAGVPAAFGSGFANSQLAQIAAMNQQQQQQGGGGGGTQQSSGGGGVEGDKFQQTGMI